MDTSPCLGAVVEHNALVARLELSHLESTPITRRPLKNRRIESCILRFNEMKFVGLLHKLPSLIRAIIQYLSSSNASTTKLKTFCTEKVSLDLMQSAIRRIYIQHIQSPAHRTSERTATSIHHTYSRVYLVACTNSCLSAAADLVWGEHVAQVDELSRQAD